MRAGHPLLDLHAALSQALLQDLPDITYHTRDWAAWNQMDKQAQAEAIRTKTEPRVTGTRRPHDDDVEVIMFVQSWGSTALGYGGIGGAAVTSAYTIIVSDGDCHCVYFGGRALAYKVKYSELTDQGKENLRQDILSQNMMDRHKAYTRYPMKQVQP